jgi:glycine C-acetyltransferase
MFTKLLRSISNAQAEARNAAQRAGKLSQTFADKLLAEGIYVIGFFYPVVPKDKARIRVQLSAAHSKEHLDKAIAAFTKVGKELKVIK